MLAKALRKVRTSWGSTAGHFVQPCALLAIVGPFNVLESHYPKEKTSLAWLCHQGQQGPVQVSKEPLQCSPAKYSIFVLSCSPQSPGEWVSLLTLRTSPRGCDVTVIPLSDPLKHARGLGPLQGTRTTWIFFKLVSHRQSLFSWAHSCAWVWPRLPGNVYSVHIARPAVLTAPAVVSKPRQWFDCWNIYRKSSWVVFLMSFVCW